MMVAGQATCGEHDWFSKVGDADGVVQHHQVRVTSHLLYAELMLIGAHHGSSPQSEGVGSAEETS